MIEVITGNALDVKQGYIVHGVNCKGVMGGGIALQIKNRWPDVYGEYRSIYTKFMDQAPLHDEAWQLLRASARLNREALPKFDWGKSALDGNAIDLLNTVPPKVDAYLGRGYRTDTSALLGKAQLCWVNDDICVVNAFTQDDFGLDNRKVNYEAVALAFEDLVQTIIVHDFPKYPIVFPQIGAGLAGGDWEIIKTIIDRTVPDTYVKQCYVLPT